MMRYPARARLAIVLGMIGIAFIWAGITDQSPADIYHRIRSG